MNPLRRMVVADNAAEALAAEIAAGRLTDHLPSSRHLAGLLGVSRPVLLHALQILQSKGIIEKSGSRQRYLVAAHGREKEPALPEPDHHALYILDEEVVRHDAFEILLSLTMSLHGKAWRISSLRMNFGHNESRPRQWQRAISGYAPDKVIVWAGRPKLAEWLHRSGIQAMFIGGDGGNTPIPVVGVSGAMAVRTMLDRLFALGHERIWLPLCNRPEAYAARLQQTMHAAFEEQGLQFSSRLHAPTSPYRGRDVIIAMFEQAWQTQRPTALMLHDWREFLAVASVLRREGLDIPKHMSVALISDDPEMEWHKPDLAHFRAPLKRIASVCASWLCSESKAFLMPVKYFDLEWIPGGSLGPPRVD